MLDPDPKNVPASPSLSALGLLYMRGGYAQHGLMTDGCKGLPPEAMHTLLRVVWKNDGVSAESNHQAIVIGLGVG